MWKELEYLREIEVEKMKLAQLADWKFMTVFKIVVGQDSGVENIDKQIFDKFFQKFNKDKLTDLDYKMFLKRFNRNNDKVKINL